MSKHTPGPWTVGTKTVLDNHGFKVNAFPVAGNGQAIAAIWAGSVGKEAFGFDNQEANARLIAAAPDLLDALHRLMSMAEAHATRKREPIAQAYIDADIAVARAAIVKAEGAS